MGAFLCNQVKPYMAQITFSESLCSEDQALVNAVISWIQREYKSTVNKTIDRSGNLICRFEGRGLPINDWPCWVETTEIYPSGPLTIKLRWRGTPALGYI